MLTRPKFGFRSTDIDTVLGRLTSTGLRLSASPLTAPLPDPDDEPFLEVAVAARVAYLTTGNQKHFPADPRQGIDVVTPRDFLRNGQWLGKE